MTPFWSKQGNKPSNGETWADRVPSPKEEGERLGRDRLVKKLGEGGMGVVFQAHDEQLDRPVAIKMIREADANDTSRQRLWREARAAASVSHPNVCQIHEVGEEKGEL